MNSDHSIDHEEASIASTQVKASFSQIPFILVLLFANAIYISYEHYETAPVWFTTGLPAGLMIVTAAIFLAGQNHLPHIVSARQVKRTLAISDGALTALVVGFVVWIASTMYFFGDAECRAHVSFSATITLLICSMCCLHLQYASKTSALLSIAPFAFYFSDRPLANMLSILAVYAFILAALLLALSKHYKVFAATMAARLNLHRASIASATLVTENMQLALHDSLTGLPNRRHFMKRAEEMLNKPGQAFYLGLIDLDGFKAVNDVFGHTTGDALLIEVSERLRTCVSPDVFVARLGGDEFGLLMSRDVDVVAFGTSVCKCLGAIYKLGDITTEVTASCGVSRFSATNVNLSQLLEQADFALYEAKSKGGDQAVLFSAKHLEKLVATHKLELALRTADFATEMWLAYQPIFNLANGRIVAFEALARWSSASQGDVSPGIFIPAAEKSSLINRLTFVLLDKLSKDIASLPPDIAVSFNLSARTLASQDAVLRLLAWLGKADVSATRMIFEVTETAITSDLDLTRNALESFRRCGASIALDDFGTGYSSLSHAHQMPLDKVKIDRKFVSEMLHDGKARSIVRTIVDLSKNLGIVCIAEGVETEAQRIALMEMGCSFAQGYLLGKPQPLHAFYPAMARAG